MVLTYGIRDILVNFLTHRHARPFRHAGFIHLAARI